MLENENNNNKYKSISSRYLSMFNDFIAQHTGLSFNENRRKELERGIRAAAKEFGFDDPEECIRRLMSSPLSKKQIEILSIHLTVGETYFFREKESFDVLESHILPQWLRSTGGKPCHLRIWSTACSTGEEPYTIAMVLDRNKEKLKNCDITILGTDINLRALEKAETGIYSEWALRSTPAWLKQEYFNKRGQNGKKFYEVKPHIKKMVQFAYLNLAEDVYPSLLNNTNAMDIIFCRNVLMYFLPQKAENVIRRLYHSLVTGRWLIVAPTDSFHVLDIECFRKHPANASVFTRCEKNRDEDDLPAPAVLPGRQPYQPPQPFKMPPVSSQPPLNVPGPRPPAAVKVKVKEETGNKNRPVNGNEIYAEALQLYKQGNYKETADRLRKVLDREQDYSDGKMFALLARSYANLGRLREAAQWCGKAIDTDKLDPDFHYLQAVILQEQGSEEEAVRALKKCLYINPDFLLAHFTLGNIMLRQNHTPGSRKHLEIARSQLESFADEDIVSGEEGLAAGRLKEIINAALEKESLHGRIGQK